MAGMSEFKFGQLLTRDDICDREREVKILSDIVRTNGRAVVYGPRRYGKSSVIKNILMADFLSAHKKSLAVYCDFFQPDSAQDVAERLQISLESALSQKARTRAFFQQVQNYVRNFKIEMSPDPLSGMPSVSLSGDHRREEKSPAELLGIVREFSRDYKTLLVFDEFQDIAAFPSLEAVLRNELQALDRTAIILSGSRQHLLTGMFTNEKRPFYGFGVDVEFGKIPLDKWIPYIRERFATHRIRSDDAGIAEICRLMGDVPNAIQEFCHWITLNNSGPVQLDVQLIRRLLADLLENKAGRYLERWARLSAKEKRVLIAVAKMEPVTSIAATEFLQMTKVSATATRASIQRFTEHGLLNGSRAGYSLTDPLFRHYLMHYYR